MVIKNYFDTLEKVLKGNNLIDKSDIFSIDRVA